MTRVVALVAAGVLVLVLVPAAAAARAPDRPIASAQPGSAFASSLTASAQRFGFRPLGSATDPIDCVGNIGDPYETKLVPGRAAVIARVRCTGRMARIGLRVNLSRRLVTVHRPLSREATSFLKGSAAMRCRPGSYRGTANVTLVFPRGYEPSPQRFNVYSRVKTLDCV